MEPATPREVRLSALVVAVCAVLIGGALSYGIVHKVNQGDAIVRTAASEADQVERLNAQIDDLRKSAAADRAAAAAERAVLKAQNTTLQLEVRAGAQGQRALLRWLRRHGIKVPVNVVMPQSAGTAASTRPKVPTGQRPRHKRHNPGSPGNTGTGPSTIAELCALVPMLC